MPGCYTDSYQTILPHQITLSEFVTAFYTTPLFKLERIILKYAASKPSTDSDIERLLQGSQQKFAAWSVEAQTENQLLMCDFHHRTRSWFMTLPEMVDNKPATRLLFGSAVTPIKSNNGEATLGKGFTALIGFHKLYSRALLYSASKALA